MSVFFTSDTHFGDPRALRFDHRPFRNLDEHDERLVANWNEAVAASDVVWFLGDFALGPSPSRKRELLAALNGTKHLIIGNNDDDATVEMEGWSSVQHYAEIVVEERTLVLCHYPFRTWNGIRRGAVNLHGHSHGRPGPITRQYDVGVDVREYGPVGLQTILSTRRRRRATVSPKARS